MKHSKCNLLYEGPKPNPCQRHLHRLTSIQDHQSTHPDRPLVCHNQTPTPHHHPQASSHQECLASSA
ncbi:hypothetical protein TorRG33x02_149250 [Trema orientale]|uniref:Uncharacterized protein n=1 Tax=Trema orientale TaxID=63057 RepID=A0A2P5EUN7_TREOI|nr:hypothetical protein TorRG33x02_149250 [Trema orientale]